MLYIATLQELKADLGIVDPIDDALLTQKAELLQGRFDAFMQRTLLRGVDVVEYFDGGSTFLMLDRFPVESVSAVYVDASGSFASDTVLDSDEYVINRARGRLLYGFSSGGKWPDGRQNIKVVYTGGYLAYAETPTGNQTAIESSIRGAFLMQFGFEWRNKSNLGNQSVSAQGGSVSLAAAELLPEVKDVLLNFKRF